MNNLVKMGAISACLFFGGATMAAPPTGAAITIQNYKFFPEALTIKAGTTVTWTNKDEDPHTVMSLTGEPRSDALDTGQTFSYAFTKPGTYQIMCTLHPQMHATIVVE